MLTSRLCSACDPTHYHIIPSPWVRQPMPNHVVVRNQEAPTLLIVHIIGEQWILLNKGNYRSAVWKSRGRTIERTLRMDKDFVTVFRLLQRESEVCLSASQVVPSHRENIIPARLLKFLCKCAICCSHDGFEQWGVRQVLVRIRGQRTPLWNVLAGNPRNPAGFCSSN
jgi:hypothetical protein